MIHASRAMATASDTTGQRTLVVLSQVYVPDPASVGQHMADAAAEMVRRGWRVKVLTSARGYDDPDVRYPARETIDGVEVRRLPLSSFGKRFFLLRIMAALLFMGQAVVHAVLTRRMDCLLVSTSPPMCIVAALIIGALRRTRIKFWVMDLNPDQLIALERITPESPSARVMDFFNRRILRRSSDVIALDRFMADRLNAKLDVSDKMAVMPPWPHEDHVEPVVHEENEFRHEHGLDGKVVLMYSGNHGLALPLATFLEAAARFKDDDRVVFMFIGGGARKADVSEAIERHGLKNMVSLPYQPIERLRYSLSAADAHLVSIGDTMVGVIHPCKIYGAMAVARPIILLGPQPSHVSDILESREIGWHIPHGDVERAEEVIRRIIEMPAAERQAMGRRARDAITTELSKEALCGRFCDVLERGVGAPQVAAV